MCLSCVVRLCTCSFVDLFVYVFDCVFALLIYCLCVQLFVCFIVWSFDCFSGLFVLSLVCSFYRVVVRLLVCLYM